VRSARGNRRWALSKIGIQKPQIKALHSARSFVSWLVCCYLESGFGCFMGRFVWLVSQGAPEAFAARPHRRGPASPRASPLLASGRPAGYQGRRGRHRRRHPSCHHLRRSRRRRRSRPPRAPPPRPMPRAFLGTRLFVRVTARGVANKDRSNGWLGVRSMGAMRETLECDFSWLPCAHATSFA